MSSERPIYLDYNATTPLLEEVVAAMLPFLQEHFGNPSSSHVYGQRTRAAISEARSQVAELIDAGADNIVFTSGGTEANNLAIVQARAGSSVRNRVITSVIEHPATERPCAALEREGFEVVRLSVSGRGLIDLEQATSEIDQQTALVTVMHSNNETGVLQPVADLTRLAKKQGALVHTDAAQSLGKVSVSVKELGVDYLSIAGHKLYAPKGVGALFVADGAPCEPLMRGAGHESGRRPGTENVASIVGLGAACVIAKRDLAVCGLRLAKLRDELHAGLLASIPNLSINGEGAPTLPNTLSVRFPNVRGDEVLARAPEVAASTGSACHDGGHRASASILALGIDQAAALGTVRLTLGRLTDEPAIRTAVSALSRAYRQAQQQLA